LLSFGFLGFLVFMSFGQVFLWHVVPVFSFMLMSLTATVRGIYRHSERISSHGLCSLAMSSLSLQGRSSPAFLCSSTRPK
jgi:hypothetical protein